MSVRIVHVPKILFCRKLILKSAELLHGCLYYWTDLFSIIMELLDNKIYLELNDLCDIMRYISNPVCVCVQKFSRK